MRVRADRYAIASASALCPVCDCWTHVVALLVPQRHTVASDQGWGIAAGRAWLFHVNETSAAVLVRLAVISPWYRPATGGTGRVFVNHCEHCASPLDDHDLHCEPGGAFQPSSEAEAAGVSLWHIDEPLDVDASGLAHEPDF